MTRSTHFRPTLEVFEGRTVPAVSAVLSGTTLNIEGSSAADVINVSEVNVWHVGQLAPETCLQVSIREGGPFSPQYLRLFSKSAVVQIYMKPNAGDDQIAINTSKNAIVYAGDGNDLVRGGAGHDVLFGGNGNDTIYGGGGNDQVRGQDGADLLYGDDLQWTGQGHDTLTGGNGNDLLYGCGGQDWLYGDDGDDRLSGDEDNDQLFGGRGDDELYGCTGADWLYGNDGSDILNGGIADWEVDEMYGGNDGSLDTFWYGLYVGREIAWSPNGLYYEYFYADESISGVDAHVTDRT